MDRVMRTFDRGVDITTASDYYPDPRYETVRAIAAEQLRRSDVSGIARDR